ncbi:hypothetical protein P353_08700 [Comamonas testosteroni]|uniref:Uncharacterized protein n=1 Tax=Comamonas testosteroni TaxID=285 RepID=A0A096H0H4_COMTE|nr:hypothetical protein P353_08700 [Comamonas testosteroni]
MMLARKNNVLLRRPLTKHANQHHVDMMCVFQELDQESQKPFPAYVRMQVQTSGGVVQPMSNDIAIFEKAIQLHTELGEQINPLTQDTEKFPQGGFRVQTKQSFNLFLCL